MGWYPCGCCKTPCCVLCSGGTPRTITVEFDGNTIVLRHQSDNKCTWQGTFAEITYKGCTYDSAVYTRYLPGSVFLNLYHSANVGRNIYWINDAEFDSGWDCERSYILHYASYFGCTPSSDPGDATVTPSNIRACENQGGSSSTDPPVGEPCESACCPDATTEIDVDLITTALTDAWCDRCNDIGAVFTLRGIGSSLGILAPLHPDISTHYGQCAWFYNQPNWCAPTQESGACADGWHARCDYGLLITVALWRDGPSGQCGYTAKILLGSYAEGPDDHPPSCNCGVIYANYKSALFDAGDCVFPITMNRFAQSVVGVCGGSFLASFPIDIV